MSLSEEEKKQNTQDFAQIMAQAMHALSDREIDSQEGAILCQAAAQLIDRCRPLFFKWWQRALLDSASSALKECADHLKTMEHWNE